LKTVYHNRTSLQDRLFWPGYYIGVVPTALTRWCTAVMAAEICGTPC